MDGRSGIQRWVCHIACTDVVLGDFKGEMKMYRNEMIAKDACAQEMLCGQLDRNPTVKENIDTKIAMLRKEIERLEESKKTLGPLMAMKIRDIREAMNY